MIPQWKKKFDKNDILKRFKYALENEKFSEGSIVKSFENKVCKFLKVKYAVAVPSGTSALLISFLALGLKPKDEIIIQNRSWISVYNAAKLLNLNIKFVDVDKNRPVLNINHLKKVLSKKTKVIVPVHMGGRICDMDELLKFIKNKNIKIVEDAAQAFGSKYQNKFAGTKSDIGCFSMSITKTISSGQGGFVVTNKKNIFERLVKLKNNGLVNINEIYNWGNIGLNLKFSDILASIAISKIKKFKIYKSKLIKNYSIYSKNLSKIKHANLIPVYINKGEIPQYIEILCNKRNKLQLYLKKKNIDTRLFYPNLSNKDNKNLKKKKFLNSEFYQKYGLYLPSGPDQKKNDIEKTVNEIKKFFNNV